MAVVAKKTNKKNTVPGQVLNRAVFMRRIAECPQQFQRALGEIRALDRLAKGWDSYGAPPIAEEARNRACAFVTMLGTRLGNRVAPPTIGPTPSGGVMLQWNDEKREIEVAFLPAGGEYSVVDRESGKVIDHGEVGRPEGVLRVVQQYVLTS